jgi:hypothetical protein
MEVWSVSRSGRFTPRERAPGTHWVGGWVGPKTGLDAVKICRVPPTHILDSNSRNNRPREPAANTFSNAHLSLPSALFNDVLSTANYRASDVGVMNDEFDCSTSGTWVMQKRWK